LLGCWVALVVVAGHAASVGGSVAHAA